MFHAPVHSFLESIEHDFTKVLKIFRMTTKCQISTVRKEGIRKDHKLPWFLFPIAGSFLLNLFWIYLYKPLLAMLSTLHYLQKPQFNSVNREKILKSYGYKGYSISDNSYIARCSGFWHESQNSPNSVKIHLGKILIVNRFLKTNTLECGRCRMIFFLWNVNISWIKLC